MTKKLSIKIGAVSSLGLFVLGCSASKQPFPESLHLVKPHIEKAFSGYNYVIPLLGGVSDVDLSPDGKKLAFQGKDGKIWTSDIDGRNQQRVSNLKWAASPTWSPDGKKIAFGSYDKIWVVDADGKNLRQLEANPNPGMYGQKYPQWSPDGLYLVWSEGDRGLRIADIDGKNGRNLTETEGFHIIVDWSPDGQSIYYSDIFACKAKSSCRRIGIDGKDDRESDTDEIAQLAQKLSDQEFIYQCQDEKIYRSPLNNRAKRKVIFDVSRFPTILVNRCTLSPDRTKLIFSISGKGSVNTTTFALDLRAIE